MKVVVNTSGFYAGTWHEASTKAVEIADAVAKPFLPPYGEQLSIPPVNKAGPSGTASLGSADAPAAKTAKAG